MARQYEVFRPGAKTLAVVIQSDLLEETKTRVVMPLLPKGAAGRPMHRLNPAIEGKAYVMMPQLLATISLDELGQPMSSIAAHRDDVTHAIDTLLAGVQKRPKA